MIAVFVVLTVFAVSTVSAANTVSFVPQHSNITGGPCNDTTVELWVNTTDAINSWNTFVSFNPACVNITDVTYIWTPGTYWAHHVNYVNIGDAVSTCVVGDMHVATLTIHCEAWGCASPLNFSGIDNATRDISCVGTHFAATWQNGTVTNEAAPPSPCNNGSVNVAFVPDPSGPGGGTLPTTNAAFDKFSFTTNVPFASVNAATLANYDTVVLITCDPMNDTNASQRTDIVNWVYNGGKLIIYDSECVDITGINTVDYTWLPCQAISFGPGGWGANKYWDPWVDLWIVENNTLSNSSSASPYYINTTKIAYDTDAAGDQNVFIAKDPCWCGDMIGTNAIDATGAEAAPGTTGYSHAYHHYNKGLIIYNGLDIDYLSAGSDPTADTGRGHLAKIWLLELNQTWDNTTGTDLCGLPCEAPIPTPTPTPTPTAVPTLQPPALIVLAGILGIIAVTVIISKKTRR